jgi:hypothetical protein
VVVDEVVAPSAVIAAAEIPEAPKYRMMNPKKRVGDHQ